MHKFLFLRRHTIELKNFLKKDRDGLNAKAAQENKPRIMNLKAKAIQTYFYVNNNNDDNNNNYNNNNNNLTCQRF